MFLFFSLRLYFCQQQCSSVGFCWAFFFSGKIGTMQFYWKLGACSSSAPTQPRLTRNTQFLQVTALTLLGYSMFNIRNALKLLMQLPSQQAQENRNTTARDGQDLTKFGFLGGEMEGVSSQPVVTPELLKRKPDQGYGSNAVSWQNPESQSCRQELGGLPHL